MVEAHLTLPSKANVWYWKRKGQHAFSFWDGVATCVLLQMDSVQESQSFHWGSLKLQAAGWRHLAGWLLWRQDNLIFRL